MQSAVLLLLLPVCCGMVIPDGPPPGPPPGCFYNGKHYGPGQIMHTSTEGDCERTLLCTEYGPVAGDSRGCFKRMLFFFILLQNYFKSNITMKKPLSTHVYETESVSTM